MAHMGSSIALLLLMIFVSTSTSTAATFTCNSTAKCRSLVGYPSPNTTFISTIQNLFNIKNLRTLLAANDLPASTGKNYTIQANQVLKIPIPCVCSNNTGTFFSLFLHNSLIFRLISSVIIRDDSFLLMSLFHMCNLRFVSYSKAPFWISNRVNFMAPHHFLVYVNKTPL